MLERGERNQTEENDNTINGAVLKHKIFKVNTEGGTRGVFPLLGYPYRD